MYVICTGTIINILLDLTYEPLLPPVCSLLAVSHRRPASIASLITTNRSMQPYTSSFSLFYIK